MSYFSIDSAINNITKFHEESKKPYARFNSWKICYEKFISLRNYTDDNSVDYLALHLAFYLASWGMYRGSSFLLQHNYKIHIPVVKILQDHSYDGLVAISPTDLFKNENLTLIMNLVDKISKVYSDIKSSYKASETLITKILLGTLGCVPAYDRYFIAAIKSTKVAKGKFDTESLRSLASYYSNNFSKFEEKRKKLRQEEAGCDYPPMKLIDMCFWIEGKQLKSKK